MATQPTNPIIKIAENDVNLPSTGKPNKNEPSSPIQTIGYDKNQVVTAEELNYILNNISEWQTYFKDFTEELQTEFDSKIQELEDQIEKERVSIGEIIEITGDSTNPSILKGYGTWESFGGGLTTVGVGSHTDDRGENKTWTDGQTEGEYQHVQTESELAQHNHTFSGTTEDNTVATSITQYLTPNGTDTGTAQQQIMGIPQNTDLTHNHTFSGTTDNTGSSSPMNNTQPSIAVYRWKRTA
ncbi:tail protein [Vibrio phage qdvp001]|uniref:tail protein n=1 Tax=Vibrio phage qdvp001 TaxID=1003177 RepID=UPI00071F5674|nr:tail protein [Vibrio phage qdvp001]ALM62166.1 putative tail fiber protein [Vibrio phage qdvp001]